MQLSLNKLTIAQLSKLLNTFGTWWLKEFLNLLPMRFVEFISGPGRPLLVVAADQEAIVLELLNKALRPEAMQRIAPRADAWAEIDGFLTTWGLTRRDVDIGLRLPADVVFARELVLPAEAGDAIDEIAMQDIARKTPFKLDDVYCDHVANDDLQGEKIVLRQWITRRQFVYHALLPLKIGVEDLAFIVFGDRLGQATALIRLWRNARPQNSWLRRAFPALCCSAVVLASISGGLRYSNQQTALDHLRVEIAATNTKAQQVRVLVEQLREKRGALARLRLEKSEAPGLIDLWEETTRVLPLHSWLTEFRLSEGPGKREEQITMMGFSNAAPSLVSIVDGSRLLFDAALTSPVAFDATEGRERFALKAKVRLPETLKEAAR